MNVIYKPRCLPIFEALSCQNSMCVLKSHAKWCGKANVSWLAGAYFVAPCWFWDNYTWILHIPRALYCRLQHAGNSALQKWPRAVHLEPLHHDVTAPRLNFYFGCSCRNMTRLERTGGSLISPWKQLFNWAVKSHMIHTDMGTRSIIRSKEFKPDAFYDENG